MHFMLNFLSKRIKICKVKNVCTNIGRSFNLERYSVKLKSDLKQFQNNRMMAEQINFIEKLYEERSKLGNSIKEIELELAKSQSENDRELQELMNSEKTELIDKSAELSQRILDSIYFYELYKNDSHISDNTNCLFEITAGVGGKEAMLFANELFEMYYNYIQYKNWAIVEMDADQQGDFLRHLRATVQGNLVWENLRFEAGVHRVQRVPETESKGRIHTSTVTVACIPVADDVHVEIKDQDLKTETKRASGAGGQHVNTTESAVRLTHIPTGIVVECQEERSQIKNREIAIKKLKKLIADQNARNRFENIMKTRKSQVGSSFRNEKIRTFNFNQDRVTDHRLSSANQSSRGDKVSSLFGLEDFFQNPARLDQLIESLRNAEKERFLTEIFNELE